MRVAMALVFSSTVVAAILSQQQRVSGPRTAADSTALAIAVYDVAFSNGTHGAAGAALPELVCVEGWKFRTDPPREVIAKLQ